MKNKKSNYTCHSLPEYNLAMNLRRKENWGEYKIQRALKEQGFDVKLGAIIGWIRLGKKPFNSKVVSQISKSSQILTKEKAYILGTLCGDGYITTNYRVGLGTVDKEFIDCFRECLRATYGVFPKIRSGSRKTNYCENPKPQFYLLLRSKLVVLDLLRYSPSFKTFEWGVPDRVIGSSKKIQAMFLRGFADSEGSVKNRHRNRELLLCSGNERGLRGVQSLMKEQGIKSYFSVRKNGVFILATSDYKSLKKFYNSVGFTISRKKEKLRAGLERYKRKGIRKYSLGFKRLAIDMLKNGYNHKEVGQVLNTSYANVHDWEKFSKDPDYYRKRWQTYRESNSTKVG